MSTKHFTIGTSTALVISLLGCHASPTAPTTPITDSDLAQATGDARQLPTPVIYSHTGTDIQVLDEPADGDSRSKVVRFNPPGGQEMLVITSDLVAKIGAACAPVAIGQTVKFSGDLSQPSKRDPAVGHARYFIGSGWIHVYGTLTLSGGFPPGPSETASLTFATAEFSARKGKDKLPGCNSSSWTISGSVMVTGQ